MVYQIALQSYCNTLSLLIKMKKKLSYSLADYSDACCSAGSCVKGIIDESVGYFNAQSTDATSYYKQSLERLFFLTLNTPIDERDELTKQHQKALFPELLVDDQLSLFKTDQKHHI